MESWRSSRIRFVRSDCSPRKTVWSEGLSGRCGGEVHLDGRQTAAWTCGPAWNHGVLPGYGSSDLTALHGKLFGVKGYPADAVVKYTWTVGKLLPGPVDLHGIMAFFPDTVRPI